MKTNQHTADLADIKPRDSHRLNATHNRGWSFALSSKPFDHVATLF
ncbi:MAG TPA: hypothetical protein VLA19_06490 [Herpetosiphonaceae bacterium]|nr:hypothetical protein [Herpetosiphonaceae bacterium]